MPLLWLIRIPKIVIKKCKHYMKPPCCKSQCVIAELYNQPSEHSSLPLIAMRRPLRIQLKQVLFPDQITTTIRTSGSIRFSDAHMIHHDIKSCARKPQIVSRTFVPKNEYRSRCAGADPQIKVLEASSRQHAVLNLQQQRLGGQRHGFADVYEDQCNDSSN